MRKSKNKFFIQCLTVICQWIYGFPLLINYILGYPTIVFGRVFFYHYYYLKLTINHFLHEHFTGIRQFIASLIYHVPFQSIKYIFIQTVDAVTLELGEEAHVSVVNTSWQCSGVLFYIWTQQRPSPYMTTIIQRFPTFLIWWPNFSSFFARWLPPPFRKTFDVRVKTIYFIIYPRWSF